MASKVYVETSVVSYLTAFPSRDIVVAAHQQITHAWWATKDKFELYVSEAVLAEAGAGDPIVDEVRAIRDEYAKSLGYDLEAIVADLRSRQEQHPERVVSLPPKRVTK